MDFLGLVCFSSTGNLIVFMQSVLYIAPQPFFAQRGSPFRVKATVTALVELGYQVDLLVLPYGEEISLAGINIKRSLPLPGIKQVPIGPSFRKIPLNVLLSLSALRRVSQKNYALIHGIEEAAFIAGVLSSFKRIPFIYDMHSWMSEQIEHSGFVRSNFLLRKLRSLEEFFLKRASGVVTVGDTHAQLVKDIASKASICALEDLPLDGANSFSTQQLKSISEEFNLQGKDVVLYTGNFEPYQGVDLLIKSFALITERHANALLLLVGGNGQSDPNYLRSRKLAEHLALRDRVVFAGLRPANEMGAFMASAKVLVSPRTDGQNTPLKIYSYMAAGKALVATRIGSHTQVLNEQNAFLAEANESDLAETLSFVLTNERMNQALVEKRIQSAKHLLETRLSRSEFVRRLGVLYSDILGSKAPGKSALHSARNV